MIFVYKTLCTRNLWYCYPYISDVDTTRLKIIFQLFYYKDLPKIPVKLMSVLSQRLQELFFMGDFYSFILKTECLIDRCIYKDLGIKIMLMLNAIMLELCYCGLYTLV